MLLLAIIIGLVVGVAAGFLLEGHNDLIVVDTLFGLAGGVAGYIFIGLLSSNSETGLPGLLGAVVGAGIAVLFINMLHKLLDKKSPPGSNL